MTREEKLSIIKNVKNGMPIDIALRYSNDSIIVLHRRSNGTYTQGMKLDNSYKELTIDEVRELHRISNKYDIKILQVNSVAGMTREQIDELDEVIKKELSK